MGFESLVGDFASEATGLLCRLEATLLSLEGDTGGRPVEQVFELASDLKVGAAGAATASEGLRMLQPHADALVARQIRIQTPPACAKAGPRAFRIGGAE